MSGSVSKAGIPIVILIVAIVCTVIMISLKPKPEVKEIEAKSFLVDAQTIVFQDIEFLVYAQGAVQPKHKTMLSSQVSGKVVAISDNFNVGGFFKKGDVLVEIEQADYQTDLTLAEAELARAQAALDEEVARGRVAEKEWSSVNTGTPPELGLRKPQLAREQANVKAASANLNRAKRNLSRTTIVAPYDGLVKSRLVDLGQFVPLGTQVGQIFSTNVAEIRLPLTDNDVAFIGELNNQQPKVSLSADVAGKKHYWQGKLVRDEAVLDESRRVIYAVVEVQDPYNLNDDKHPSELKFGRFVSAAISGMKANDIVKLPRYVVRLDGTVITVTENQTLKINQVEVIRADEEFVYISAGLRPQDKVVMSAVSTPYDGMPVRFTDETPSKPINSEQGKGIGNSLEVETEASL